MKSHTSSINIVQHYPSCEQKRRWSDCADAQMRLCCSHMQLADFLTTWIIIITYHHRDKTIQFMNIRKHFLTTSIHSGAKIINFSDILIDSHVFLMLL